MVGETRTGEMSKINDLIASAKTVCDRYEKGAWREKPSENGSCVWVLIHRRMAIVCGKRRSGSGLTLQPKCRPMCEMSIWTD